MIQRTQSDIMRRESKTFRLAHCLLPAWGNGEIDSASERGSIAIAFTGQTNAVVREFDGVARPRSVPPMTIGLGGDVPIVWLETASSSDVLEITGAAELRQEMARDMRVESHANLDDVHGWQDPIIQAIATRLRAALRRWKPMSDLEAETLVRAAYAQTLRRHFGGRDGVPGTLDARRRQRVVELVLEIRDRPPSWRSRRGGRTQPLSLRAQFRKYLWHAAASLRDGESAGARLSRPSVDPGNCAAGSRRRGVLEPTSFSSTVPTAVRRCAIGHKQEARTRISQSSTDSLSGDSFA
jgi:hypothetical protein